MKDWLKEFDEKFGKAYVSDKEGGYFISSYLIDFINKLLIKQKKEIRELVAKKRPIFMRNNIVDLIETDEAIRIREQLRKEILKDIDN